MSTQKFCSCDFYIVLNRGCQCGSVGQTPERFPPPMPYRRPSYLGQIWAWIKGRWNGTEVYHD